MKTPAQFATDPWITSYQRRDTIYHFKQYFAYQVISQNIPRYPASYYVGNITVANNDANFQ